MLDKHLYCVKCHSGKTVVGQSPVVMKNGAVALKGTCPSCDSTAYKIVSKEALQKRAEDKMAQALPSKQYYMLMAFLMFAAGLALGAVLANAL